MSVISRMLQDLESRGATSPVTKAPVARDTAAVRTEAVGSGWIRTVALSGGLLIAIAGLYSAKMPAWVTGQDEPKLSTRTSHAMKPGAQARLNLAGSEPNWKLDWALSLGLIKSVKPALTTDAIQLSLSPNLDVSDLTEQSPVRQEVEPRQVDANANSVLVIDPPAAGRVQSTNNQAVEAYRRALDQMDQGRDAVALDTLLQAIKLDAAHLPARRVAIALALDQKQFDLAGNLLDEGLKLEPKDTELLYLHARHLVVAGSDDRALQALQQMDRPTSEALGLKAGLLAKTGRYAPAAAAYEQALKSKPDNATWWLGLGVAWHAQGQTDMAKQAFLRARKLGQLSPDVQAWLDQQI